MATKLDSGLIVHDGGLVKDVLDNAKSLANYTALRGYTGTAAQIRITQTGLAGFFYRDDADTSSTDNGGTVILASNGKRWKRIYDGTVNVLWFGADATGGTDSTSAIDSASSLAAAAGGGTVFFPTGRYKYTRLIIRSGVSFTGAGHGSTFLICTDYLTLDAGTNRGSSFRAIDNNARVLYAGFRNLSIYAGATSGAATQQDIYQNIIGLNLCMCERTIIQDVSFGGWGQGALMFSRAEAGNEGLGFVNSTQDGNYNQVTNASFASCGKYNADNAAVWLKYKANSNKFYGLYAKGMIGSGVVSVSHGNDNLFAGGTAESCSYIFKAGGGTGASGNTVLQFRAEGLTGNAYEFLASASNNYVFGGYHTGVTGNLFVDAVGSNRIISDRYNNLRSKTFPPTESYSTYHNHGALKVTSINGDSDYPLYIKSEKNGDPSSYPYAVFYSDVSGGVVGNILGRLAFRNGDTTTGAAGVSAAVDAVLEGSDGTTGIEFSSGTGTSFSKRIKITGTGNFLPLSDNTQSCATSALRWSEIYSNVLKPGAGSVKWTSGVGSPEGVVTAVVGSLYTRSDGAANTTLYVKETGTGNTGWIAK